MQHLCLAIFLVFSLVISGCASHGRHQPSANFTTESSPDGRQLFTYNVLMPMPEKRHMGQRPAGERPETGTQRNPGRPMLAEDMTAMVKPRVYAMLYEKLDETGYCPGGYSVNEEHFGPESFIKGECIPQQD